MVTGSECHPTKRGKSFFFEGTHEVQVVIISNEPYFVAADVCHILKLSNVTDKLKNTLEISEYLPYVLHRSGQKRTVNVVSESGLYTLIFQSREPVAKSFRRWVTIAIRYISGLLNIIRRFT